MDSQPLAQATAPTAVAPPASRTWWLHLAGALLVVVLWGVSFAVTRAAVRELPPMTLALLRFALACGVLWPAVRVRCGRVRLDPADRWGAFGLGFVGVTLYFACENVGLQYTTASHGALIVATIPLATVLAEAAARRRRPPAAVLGGLVAALGGVGLLVGGDQGGEASLYGDALMFGAVVSWVAYTFLADRLGRRYPSLWLTLVVMAVGTATLLPLAAWEWRSGWPAPPSGAAWASVVFLGVFCSAAGYLLWNGAIPVLGVSVTNNLIYGIPLVGVLAGVLLLGESLSGRVALGGALVVGGVVLASRRG